MPLLINAKLPDAVAREFAFKTDPRTATDLGYIVKDAICEAFGDSTIRPFRIITNNPGVIQIIGWTKAGDILKPTPTGKAVISHLEFSSWNASKGQELTFSVLACPMESITYSKEAIRRNEPMPRARDVGASKKFPNKIAAYNNWLITKLKDPNTGCIPLSVGHFTSTERFMAIRKTRGNRSDPTREIMLPSFEATIKVRIINPDAFDRFLIEGLGRQRAFGYGCILPMEILNDFVVH